MSAFPQIKSRLVDFRQMTVIFEDLPINHREVNDCADESLTLTRDDLRLVDNVADMVR